MTDLTTKLMTYAEGIEFMKSISLKESPSQSFIFGEFTITYPGYKKDGDYRLSYTINNTAPKHTDVINILVELNKVNSTNDIAKELETIYNEGLKAKTTIIPESLKIKIYSIALQEEINYPQPKYQGIKMPFQRFYEALLVKDKLLTVKELYDRTNNHGKPAPTLNNINTSKYYLPLFYN